MKTEFSTSITQASSQYLITPIITSIKDDLLAILVVPLLIAWQVMHETSMVSSLPNELLQQTKTVSEPEWQTMIREHLVVQ
jgi:archaellum biogenesis protein FlaJ (TadC family)